MENNPGLLYWMGYQEFVEVQNQINDSFASLSGQFFASADF